MNELMSFAGDPFLSPQGLLYTILVMLALCVGLVSLLIVVMNRRYTAEQAKYGPVKPLFRHVKAELSAILRHDGEWAEELDELMAEDNNEEVPMAPERRERMKVLLEERAVSNHPDLRENEREAAVAYLALAPLAEKEPVSAAELTGVTIVGTPAPKALSVADKDARQEAIEN